jgi:hypothetical protein
MFSLSIVKMPWLVPIAKSKEQLSGAAVDDRTSTSEPREWPGPNMILGPVQTQECQRLAESVWMVQQY